MSMITATAWVPRGFAAPFPKKYEFNEEEFERIAELAKLQLDDAKEDLHAAQDSSARSNGSSKKSKKPLQSKEDIDDDLKEYNLDNYDDSDSDDGERTGVFGNVKSLAYYNTNEKDPYLVLKENEDGNNDDEDDDDREDLQILPTDNLLLAAKVEDELAHLEVYVYEDDADNLYVHHDLMLPAIPLCVEWLDFPVGSKTGSTENSTGNFAAIGTFEPDIEIWDLDLVDSMYPNAILGPGAEPEANETEVSKKKKKKKRSRKVNDEYHVDAVIALAANRQHRNLLVSASADKTIKLWDLNTAKCAKSYGYHDDKVCTLAWNPKEPTILLSGSYDRTAVAKDMRAPEAKAPRWGVESDIENVLWDPHGSEYFYVSTENGMLHRFDARTAPTSPQAAKSVWTLQAHDERISAVDINSQIPGFIVTGSIDKTVKIWNVADASSGPTMVVSRDLGVGKVFSASFAPDTQTAFRLSVAGSKGTLQVWDTSTNAAVRRTFAGRLGPAALAARSGETDKERMIGVANDDSDEDDDSEDDGGVEVDGANDGWESASNSDAMSS